VKKRGKGKGKGNTTKVANFNTLGKKPGSVLRVMETGGGKNQRDNWDLGG